jgi:multidrug efflux pump
MISRFFIDRPIFAAVLSIVITLVGGIALVSLPIAQYPPITPPSVQASISYPGASAQVVADTVASPIEQQVNGVQGMLYMSSQCGNDGSYTLSVTFDIGTDLNTALVMVQNRVTLAIPQLPSPVQQQGITIKKKTPDLLMIVTLSSPDGRYDDLYLSNFATINIRDELLRVDGVSDITYLGQRDYSIRAWLDPQKMAACGLSAIDVAAAIRAQNVDVAAGQVPEPPSLGSPAYQLPIGALGRLTEPEQFGEIIVKVGGGPPANQGVARVGPALDSTGAPTAGPASTLQSTATTTASQATAAQPSVNQTLGGTASANGATPALAGVDMTGSGSDLGLTTSRLGGSTQGLTTSRLSTGAGTASTTTVPPPPTPPAPSPGGGATTGGATSAGGGTTSGGLVGGTTTDATTAMSVVRQVAGATGNGILGGPTMGRGSGAPAPGILRLRDVARVELGAQDYSQSCTFDGRPSVGLAVRQLPDTNALDIARTVRAKMEELKDRFPDGVAYQIPYDTTPFIQQSVDEVARTLLEAVLLVAVVVLVFLQSWRATLIPLVAVPVAIVGTFAVMAALGFSLNNISLFGLVLAIGIVVDDAIVVVENVERWLEHGLPPREAARRAMDEVTGPVVAVALVLCAVFVPCAFIAGITGQFFRQFAVTIAVSTVFSAFNSLTLSPALAAILLRPRGAARDPLTRLLDLFLGWPFRVFNRAFDAATGLYARTVGLLLRGSIIVLLVYGGLVALTFWVFGRAPTGFIPQQDQGRLIVNIQLPDSASLQRTQDAMAQVDKIARETPGVAHAIGIAGISFVMSGNASNFGSMFVILDPFEARRSPHLRDTAIMAHLRREWSRQVKDALVTVYGAPPVPGLSVAGGFKLMVEDRGGLGLDALQARTDDLIRKLQSRPGLSGVSTQFRARTPQLFMDIDRTKAEAMGVSLDELNQTLQIDLGSLYATSFNRFGRYWQVNLQAEGKFRARVDEIRLLEVRNRGGQMVPLGSLVTLRETGGPVFVTRYNLSAAAPVTGNLQPGTSSGQAIADIEGLSAQVLPQSMKTEWTELMFMQIRAGDTAIYVFALSVICVFLALAALFESWSLPLAVVLVVPMCLLCSVAGVLATGRPVDIFVQIGLIVLVGLACKNAILIVEFARRLHREGRSLSDASREASRLRLRPILMTSLAFILGVVPLVVAEGAGAEMRRSLGMAVFSGMLGVTAFGVFLTPVFFRVLQGLGETRLFAAAPTRWCGTCALGVGLGAVLGFLLARLGLARPIWGPIVGGGAGVLAALLILGLRRRIERARKARAEGGPRP